jgi:hypothetical protein
VFVELELAPGQYAYNRHGLRVYTAIDCVPPDATYFHIGGCTPLYSTPFAGTGTQVGNLVSANHDPYPGCGSSATGSCYEPHDTPACRDEQCCARVCELAPFCCQVAWNENCAGFAQQACPPTGACCRAPAAGPEECFETTEADCRQNEGTFQGNGTLCEETPCSPPQEACCAGGFCFETTREYCRQVQGVPQGHDSRCLGDGNENGLDDLCELDKPCEDCGPGPHWVDQCPGGMDIMSSGAVLGVDLNDDCVADQNIVIFGNANVRRSGPLDDSNQFPGFRPVDDHRDVIDTEMVSMSLGGGGVTLIAGGGYGQGGMLRRSLGAMGEQSGDAAMVDSFFDIFTELSIDGGGSFMYNQTPISVKTAVTCVPPDAIYVHVTGCTPLYSSPHPGAGTFVANLVSANHFTYPGCCFGDFCARDVAPELCRKENGTVVPDCLGPGPNDPACECGPKPDKSGCRETPCPARVERCQPKCATLDPATGQVSVERCDCAGPSECHVEISGGSNVALAGECTVPDNGSGTAQLPPPGCPYLSPDEVHLIIDGLPADTTIELGTIHTEFICRENNAVCSFTPGVDCSEVGGSLGGEKECMASHLLLNMHGTGGMAGFARMINLPVAFETHIGPRMPGQPMQSFDTDMFRLFGQMTNPGSGDPDFDLLRITAGSDFGLPSPGHTILSRLPDGTWHVDSFFDITYRIDFVGKPGGALGGMSGSTTGTIRMQTATAMKCRGGCAEGEVCAGRRIPHADGSITLCCDCQPGAVEVDHFDKSVGRMELQFPDGDPEIIDLTGPTTVHVFFEGPTEGTADDDDGDGLDDVLTEMVDMQLTGFSPRLGPLVIRLHPTKPSRGLIEETANVQVGRLDLPPFAPGGTAFSFFDIFFEIEVGDRKFHTQEPKRMSSLIDHKPPDAGTSYENPNKIPILDENGNPTGLSIGASRHIPRPPVEIDHFESSTGVIELQFPTGASELIAVGGPTTVHVFFEGAGDGTANDDDNDGLDEVATHMVDMQLSGFSPTLGPIHIRLHPTKPSRGLIEEVANTEAGRLDVPPFAPAGTAFSFFDIFFEVDIGPRRLHTQQPKRMSSVIDHKPPDPGTTYENPNKVPLLDENGNPTGFSIGGGRHIPNPLHGCCLPKGQCDVTTVERCREANGTPLGPNAVCEGDANRNGTDDACEVDKPCEDCGPGPHWIDQCPGGADNIASGAVVGIDTTNDCQADMNFVLSGDALVARSFALDDSQQFPGLRPVDLHRDVIDTEIVAMELTGGGLALRAGAGAGQGSLLRRTLGAIAEQPIAPAVGDSFFDVFFELQIGPGQYVYNHQPVTVGTTVTCLPPQAIYHHQIDCVPLFSSPVGGTHVANLVSARHGTFPECGDDFAGDCFEPHNGPACDKAECCERVCAAIPSCCETAWGVECAAAARERCLQPTVVKWESVVVHLRGVGPVALEIPANGTFSEPRSAVTKLVVTFDRPIDPATAVPEHVNLCGLMPGPTEGSFVPVDLSNVTMTVKTSASDTRMEINFTPGLPDFARYRIELKGIRGPGGPLKPGTGGLTRIFTALQGDAFQDLRVNATDVGGARNLALVGTDPIDPTNLQHVRSDANNDGRVNATDVGGMRARALRGVDARAIPDPSCAP